MLNQDTWHSNLYNPAATFLAQPVVFEPRVVNGNLYVPDVVDAVGIGIRLFYDGGNFHFTIYLHSQ